MREVLSLQEQQERPTNKPQYWYKHIQSTSASKQMSKGKYLKILCFLVNIWIPFFPDPVILSTANLFIFITSFSLQIASICNKPNQTVSPDLGSQHSDWSERDTILLYIVNQDFQRDVIVIKVMHVDEKDLKSEPEYMLKR